MNQITNKKVISALNKLDLVVKDLNEVLIEREEVIELLVFCLIARENIVLLGPPGTAKSMLADELCRRIENADIFKKLLTQFTEETELFISGKSISKETIIEDEVEKELQKVKRETKGMLPHKDIAFLDEIFKANSAILNAMLTLINEREYHVNNEVIKSNLITVIGASNEHPAPNAGLEALYDRFLVRYYVDNLHGNKLEEMLKMDNKPKKEFSRITKDDLKELYDYLDKIQIPDNIYKRISKIKEEIVASEYKGLKNLKPSDRRLKKSLNLLKARALYYRRSIVDDSDIKGIFPSILWDTTLGETSTLDPNSFLEIQKILGKDSPIIADIKKGNDEITEKEKELQVIINCLNNAINKKDSNSGSLFKDYCLKYQYFISKINENTEYIENRLSEENLHDEKVLRDYKEKWDKKKSDRIAEMYKIANKYESSSNTGVVKK